MNEEFSTECNNTYMKLEELHRYEHHVMASFGGFIASYAIMVRMDFMGNAMTSNWIYMVHGILGSNWREVGIRFVGVLLYLLGAVTFSFVKNRCKIDVRYVALGINFCLILILCMIPYHAHPIISLYPIFFAMSFQWNAFPGAYDYVSSTIFSTNNTRQVGLALGDYLFGGRDRTKLHKMCFFLGSILFFHIGVVISYFLTKAYGIFAPSFAYIILAIESIILLIEYRQFSMKQGDFYGK